MAIIKWNPLMGTQISPFIDWDNFSDLIEHYVEKTTAIDMWEDNSNVYVSAEVPGFTKEQLAVSMEGSTLTIKGKQKEEKEEKKGKKYYRKEIRSQSLLRSITLPSRVAADKIKAELKNGILELILPKVEEAKPKEIKISESKA